MVWLRGGGRRRAGSRHQLSQVQTTPNRPEWVLGPWLPPEGRASPGVAEEEMEVEGGPLGGWGEELQMSEAPEESPGFPLGFLRMEVVIDPLGRWPPPPPRGRARGRRGGGPGRGEELSRMFQTGLSSQRNTAAQVTPADTTGSGGTARPTRGNTRNNHFCFKPSSV